MFINDLYDQCDTCHALVAAGNCYSGKDVHTGKNVDYCCECGYPDKYKGMTTCQNCLALRKPSEFTKDYMCLEGCV